MIKKIGIILVLCIFTGCNESPEKPDVLIDEETYISLLIELQLVRTYSETDQLNAPGADSLRNHIFQEYDVSAAAFWDSHKYYQQFPKEQKGRIDEAIEWLRMDQAGDSTRIRRGDGSPD